MQNWFKTLVKDGESDALRKKGAELEALDKELGGIMPGQPFNMAQSIKQVKFQTAARAYQKALNDKSDPAELAKLEPTLPS